MNTFASDEALYELMNLMMPNIKQAVAETTTPNKTRGSPEAEGKASREVNYDEETAIDNKKGQNEDERNQYTNILAGKTVSTFDRSEDNIWEHSKNTRTLKGILGLSYEQLRRNNIKAGQSGWLEDYQGANGVGDRDGKQKARRFLQSFRRELSRIKLRSYDTVGRKLPQLVK